MPVERERKSTVLDVASIHTMRAARAARLTAEKATADKAIDETAITSVETPTAASPADKPTTRKRA